MKIENANEYVNKDYEPFGNYDNILTKLQYVWTVKTVQWKVFINSKERNYHLLTVTKKGIIMNLGSDKRGSFCEKKFFSRTEYFFYCYVYSFYLHIDF